MTVRVPQDEDRLDPILRADIVLTTYEALRAEAPYRWYTTP